jgi:hypothetical protein
LGQKHGDDGGPRDPVVKIFVADAMGQRSLVVVDSGATKHCFTRHADFVEYFLVLREGTAAEGSKF